MPLRFLLIDDHPLFSHGFATLLRQLDPASHVVLAADAESGLLQASCGSRLDLALIDLGLPGVSGLELLRTLRARLPSLPVVIVSAREESETVREAIGAGAMGYIPKSSPVTTMLAALRLVLDGGVYVPPSLARAGEPAAAIREGRPAPGDGAEEAAQCLTLRQMEVLALLCEGHSNKLIAQEMNLAEQTVKGHVSAIFRALGVVSRTQAILRARSLGLVAHSGQPAR